METYETAAAADRAGLTVDELSRMVELAIVKPGTDGRFTASHIRRAELVGTLVTAGIPLDGLGAVMQGGQVSLDFLDVPAYERFSTLSDVTFAQLAEQTAVPIELLMHIREATGSSPPRPDDRVRDGELPYAEFVAYQVAAGFNPITIQQLLRAAGDCLRRLVETESAWWNSEVMAPAVAAGQQPDLVAGAEFVTRMNDLNERAVIELYHLLQAKAWTTNIIDGVETTLAAAGLHSRVDHPRPCASWTSPAIPA